MHHLSDLVVRCLPPQQEAWRGWGRGGGGGDLHFPPPRHTTDFKTRSLTASLLLSYACHTSLRLCVFFKCECSTGPVSVYNMYSISIHSHVHACVYKFEYTFIILT